MFLQTTIASHFSTGMVGRVTRTFQDNLLRLLLAISEGRGEVAAEAAIKMGEPKENFDRKVLRDELPIWWPKTLTRCSQDERRQSHTERSHLSRLLVSLTGRVTMIAKALLNLDRVVYTLDPTFDPNVIIRERANEILQRNIIKSMAPNNLWPVL